MSHTHITQRDYESRALRRKHGCALILGVPKPLDSEQAYSEFLRAFGEVVRKRRMALGLSQGDVAGTYNQANVSRIEKGNQGFDSEFLFNLSCSLQVDLATLFAFSGIEEGAVRAHYEILSPAEYRMLQDFRRLPNEDARVECIQYIHFKTKATSGKSSAEILPILPGKRVRRRK